MSLDRTEFALLSYLVEHGLGRQALNGGAPALAKHLDLSLSKTEALLSEARSCGLVDEGLHVTRAGLAALSPYKVDNAVVMAAGLSSRFAPLSYEKPKGLLRVRGEVLVERQIRQLREAGVDDVTMVVGYKKEYFFYLASKLGVRLVVNPLYATHNNSETLYLVRDRLANTYVCSSDDYFTQNPFHAYEWQACYSTVHVDGPTDEWCVHTAPDGRIDGATVGGHDSWVMLGHAYFDRTFSKAFASVLEQEHGTPGFADKLWESVWLEHADRLRMVEDRQPAGVVHEFDSPDDLVGFDPAFMENVDSRILDNISSTLHCGKGEIHDFYPLEKGLTNLSCHFATDEGEYVYRHPGVGTDKLVDRRSEKAALELAKRLGLDTTFVHEDAEQGWKISRFLPDARPLDASDDGQLELAMRMCRTLHGSGAALPRRFDFFEEGAAYEAQLSPEVVRGLPGLAAMHRKAERLHSFVEGDGFPVCASHNDPSEDNFLVDGTGECVLIDWEYAGMSDVANDFGTFCVSARLSAERVELAMRDYLGHRPDRREKRHFWAAVALAGWCWYMWSLVKEAAGEDVGDWAYTYFEYAASNLDRVIGWYEAADSASDGPRG